MGNPFDAHLPAPALEDLDLENLAYFGLRRAVIVGEKFARFETSGNAVSSLTRLAFTERARLRRFGIESVVAAGLSAAAAPDRVIPEYYARLDQLVASGDVAVVGPLGWTYGEPWEVDLFRRQVAIARRHQRPIYLYWSELPTRAAEAMDAVLAEHGVPWSDLWMIDVPTGSLAELAIAARPAIVAVPPGGVDVATLSDWLERYGDRGRFMLGSALDVSTVDVTALVRAHQDLGDRGIVDRLYSPGWGRSNP